MALKPINLKAVRAKREDNERTAPLKVLRDAVDDIGAAFESLDGWALVVFERAADGKICTMTRYRTRDPLDVFVLPQMAKLKIERAINESTEEAD